MHQCDFHLYDSLATLLSIDSNQLLVVLADDASKHYIPSSSRCAFMLARWLWSRRHRLHNAAFRLNPDLPGSTTQMLRSVTHHYLPNDPHFALFLLLLIQTVLSSPDNGDSMYPAVFSKRGTAFHLVVPTDPNNHEQTKRTRTFLDTKASSKELIHEWSVEGPILAWNNVELDDAAKAQVEGYEGVRAVLADGNNVNDARVKVDVNTGVLIKRRTAQYLVVPIDSNNDEQTKETRAFLDTQTGNKTRIHEMTIDGHIIGWNYLELNDAAKAEVEGHKGVRHLLGDDIPVKDTGAQADVNHGSLSKRANTMYLVKPVDPNNDEQTNNTRAFIDTKTSNKDRIVNMTIDGHVHTWGYVELSETAAAEVENHEGVKRMIKNHDNAKDMEFKANVSHESLTKRNSIDHDPISKREDAMYLVKPVDPNDDEQTKETRAFIDTKTSNKDLVVAMAIDGHVQGWNYVTLSDKAAAEVEKYEGVKRLLKFKNNLKDMSGPKGN